MSKSYHRPRTPPSPIPSSKTTSSKYDNGGKIYPSSSSKSLSSRGRDYEKFSSYDKYESRDRYDSKYDTRYDRYGKDVNAKYKSSSYRDEKSFSPTQPSTSRYKETMRNSKKRDSYDNDRYERKSKNDEYYSNRYSSTTRDSSVSKYPSKSTDKYSHSSKFSPENGKEYSTSDRKYSPYLSSAKPSSYSKYSSDSHYDRDDYSKKAKRSFDSYSRSDDPDFVDRKRLKSPEIKREKSDRFRETSNTTGSGYQRYVIGDSVVYGSPGHYPKELYSPSRSHRARSPMSPALPSETSRYPSGSKRYGSSYSERLYEDDYSDSYRYKHGRSDRPCTPPLSARGNGHSNDRYERKYEKEEKGDFYPRSLRDEEEKCRMRSRESSYAKSSYPVDNADSYRDSRRSGLPSRYTPRESSFRNGPREGELSPPPSWKSPRALHPRGSRPEHDEEPPSLLSIPVSLSHLPRESRENLRDTLCIPRDRPLHLINGERIRRLDARIGLKKRGAPGDLRMLIASEKRERTHTTRQTYPTALKHEGQHSLKTKASVLGRRVVRTVPTGRTRMLDSRRRILDKGKKRNGVVSRTTSRTTQDSTRDKLRKKIVLSKSSNRTKSPSGLSSSSRNLKDDELSKRVKRESQVVKSKLKSSDKPLTKRKIVKKEKVNDKANDKVKGHARSERSERSPVSKRSTTVNQSFERCSKRSMSLEG